MKILGIETSCDETAVAIVENKTNIMASIINSQIDIHKKFGGIVPEVASRQHCENIDKIVQQALDQAKISLDNIDAVAVTFAPGLVGALLVGINFAKGLCLSLNKPIIPVHHIKAHIAACYIENKGLKPPFISMVMSGGHTHIIEVLSYTKFKIIGQTRDDAVGETFDKVARAMGFSYPGGKIIDDLSKDGDPLKYKLPTPKISNSKYDFSFSGLKTAVINLINKAKQNGLELNKNDLAASFQSTVSTMIGSTLLQATLDYGYKKIAIAGGVACNSGIRLHLSNICSKNEISLFMPSPILCTDNAVMIALQGFYEYDIKNIGDLSLNAIPYLPINL